MQAQTPIGFGLLNIQPVYRSVYTYVFTHTWAQIISWALKYLAHISWANPTTSNGIFFQTLL